MRAYIGGFICALVLAALVIAWIAYCMFFKERHKSESYQYDITDIRQQNIEVSQQQDSVEITPEKKTGLAAGIFILPSRHRHKDDDYEKRPDYPEGPAHNLQPGPDQLVELFTDSVSDSDVNCNAATAYEVDSSSACAYHSEV